MFGLREGEVDIALWVKRFRKGAGLLLVSVSVVEIWS